MKENANTCSDAKYTPQHSGISPRTMLSMELEKTKILLEKQANNIITKMKEEVDKHNENGINYQVKKLLGEVIPIFSQ